MSFENLIPCCRIEDMKTGRLMKNMCVRPSVIFLRLIRSENSSRISGIFDFCLWDQNCRSYTKKKNGLFFSEFNQSRKFAGPLKIPLLYTPLGGPWGYQSSGVKPKLANTVTVALLTSNTRSCMLTIFLPTSLLVL